MLVFFLEGIRRHVRRIFIIGRTGKDVPESAGLEAALMELTLHAEKQGLSGVGDNIRGALWAIGENAGHIKQGLAKLKRKNAG